MKKFGLGLLILAGTFMPVYVFLIVRHLLAPNGFWQELVLSGLGYVFLGGWQIAFAMVGGYLLWRLSQDISM